MKRILAQVSFVLVFLSRQFYLYFNLFLLCLGCNNKPFIQTDKGKVIPHSDTEGKVETLNDVLNFPTGGVFTVKPDNTIEVTTPNAAINLTRHIFSTGKPDVEKRSLLEENKRWQYFAAGAIILGLVAFGFGWPTAGIALFIAAGIFYFSNKINPYFGFAAVAISLGLYIGYKRGENQ